jgi:hypothetical protein
LIVLTRTFRAPRRLMWEAMFTCGQNASLDAPTPEVDDDHL